MKTTFLFLISIFCLFNCETKKNKEIQQNNSDTIINKNNVIQSKNSYDEFTKPIPIIKLSEKDSLNSMSKKNFSNNSKYLSLNESKLFKAYYPTLNKLYLLENIKKGITVQTNNSIEVSEIYYKNNTFAQQVFENIKKQLLDKNNESEKGNFFFDYFKKGTVYLLDNNKIIAITYNPFTFPKTDKFINTIVVQNKNSFKSIIKTYMIGSYETIKD